MFSEKEAEVIEIGDVKISNFWTNLYIKFRLQDGQELWFYYSEHNNKPPRICQIKDFVSGIVKVGTKMTLNYKITQSENKSNKLAIINLANYSN